MLNISFKKVISAKNRAQFKQMQTNLCAEADRPRTAADLELPGLSVLGRLIFIVYINDSI